MNRKEIHENDLLQIGENVVDAAEELFKRAGYKSDFCIQSVGTNAVFGAHNRVLYHPISGFQPDRGYCSAKFLKAFNEALTDLTFGV